ncbi:MAG: hemerythrin domain-containing protein [bacterium]
MSHTDPIETLVAEHEVISSVLDAVDATLRRELSEARHFDHDTYRRAFEFFAEFADRWHHAKEEEILFPELEHLGIAAEGGPIGCMLREHDEGRAFVRAVREALKAYEPGDAAVESMVRGTAARYVELLRAHIYKENEALFVMADRVLSDSARDEMRRRFVDAELASGGDTERRRFVEIAADLARAARARA